MKNLDFLTLLKKYELLIAAGTVLLFVLFLSAVFLLPNFSKAQEIFSKETQLRAKLSQLTKKDKLLTSLNQEFYTKTFPKIVQVLPQSRDYLSLFSRFDTLESQTGVSILRTDFQLGVVSTSSAQRREGGGEQATAVAMNFEVIGTPAQIQKFLDSLTDLTGRFMSVEDFQITFREDSLLQANFNGRAYFSILPGAIGGVDSPLPVLDKEKETLMAKIAQNQLVIAEEEAVTGSIGKKDLFK